MWQKLRQHHRRVADREILSLFDDPGRFGDFSAETEGLLLDYSKTNIDANGLSLLLELAESLGLAEKRGAMFSGAKINSTENRAVLHTALRSTVTKPLEVDGVDIRPGIAETLQRMEEFTEAVRVEYRFTDVVNIGIGGSDLGPVMAYQALKPYQSRLRLHFVSNVDGAHVSDILAELEPSRTLVIIASKTFTTIETMTNAETVLKWLQNGVGQGQAPEHLVAVSSAPEKTQCWGIDPARVFGFGDWVGGRYSLWGAVGLSIMLAIGVRNFRDFLAGAEAMDQHFRTAEFAANLPVLFAVIGIWHRNICGYPTRAILPYDQRLAHLPAYLQQLDMESNGKRVTLCGDPVAHHTGAVIWGQAGTNGQHSFYQLLHQGTDVIPTEFLIAAEGHEAGLRHHHDLLVANCLAQSEALMTGSAGDLPEQVYPGNRPSITLTYSKLTPYVLGQIIALYEHRTFTEGVIWNINSFDQMGVELGKNLASEMLELIRGADSSYKNASTQGLLQKLRVQETKDVR